MPTAYPTAGNLRDRLQSAGLTIGSGLACQLEILINSAKADLERRTNRKFLAVAGTREFDPPTVPAGILNLHGDLASLTSVTVGGTNFTLGTDFYLLEQNAADEGKPYWGLEFFRRWYAPIPFQQRRSVVVIGSWGWGASIPDDVWAAMLSKAALLAFGAQDRSSRNGILRWTDGDRTVEYGDKQSRTLLDLWAADYDAVAAHYARWSPL